jgi:ElaB/YqjD/DUF883 family membrane-anchored ribosome-binding protein
MATMRRVTALLKRTRICLEFAARAGFGCFNFSRRQSAGCYCVPIFRDLLVHPTKHHPTNTGHKDEVIGSKDLPEGNIMDEHQYPSEATESGKDNLISAAGNLKEAAGAKAEDLRQAAGQKADELRSAAQDKAQELRGAAESAWSDARSKTKSWHSAGEAYVRDNPTKAVLIAPGFGLLLGLWLRK